MPRKQTSQTSEPPSLHGCHVPDKQGSRWPSQTRELHSNPDNGCGSPNGEWLARLLTAETPLGSVPWLIPSTGSAAKEPPLSRKPEPVRAQRLPWRGQASPYLCPTTCSDPLYILQILVKGQWTIQWQWRASVCQACNDSFTFITTLNIHEDPRKYRLFFSPFHKWGNLGTDSDKPRITQLASAGAE